MSLNIFHSVDNSNSTSRNISEACGFGLGGSLFTNQIARPSPRNV